MAGACETGAVRRLGLLGGMSWESSVEYERLINQAVRAARGGVASADLLVRSFDFAEVEALQAAGRWDDAGVLLADAAGVLVAGGAEAIVICTNTMHRVYGAVAAAVTPVPVLHIADATAEAVHAAGLTSVGLLGTRFTMEQDFYLGRMRDEHGLAMVLPEADDRNLVHRVIYDELVQGVISPASRSAYQDVVARLVDRGAAGVIAGCTEIELLLGPDDVPVPWFPTTRLHAEAAATFALDG